MSRCHSRWADANKCLPNPKKPGSYAGFAEMANTQKNPPFSVGRFPSSIIVYVSSSSGRMCKLPCDFRMGWGKPVQRLPKPQWKEKEKILDPSHPGGVFWAGFPRVIYIHTSVIPCDSYQTEGRFSSPTLNQPTNQPFFYISWLNKKKHTKSFNDASYKICYPTPNFIQFNIILQHTSQMRLKNQDQSKKCQQQH